MPQSLLAAQIDPDRAAVRWVAAVCGEACGALPRALEAIEREYRRAADAGLEARAVVLAALGAHCLISEFADLSRLARWADRLSLHALEVAALEAHAALLYCAGVLAVRQFGSVARVPGAETCVAA